MRYGWKREPGEKDDLSLGDLFVSAPLGLSVRLSSSPFSSDSSPLLLLAGATLAHFESTSVTTVRVFVLIGQEAVDNCIVSLIQILKGFEHFDCF